MRATLRSFALLRTVLLGAAGLGAVLSSTACAPAHQAYIEWRPGLSPTAFDGTFELSLDEFEAFDDEGAAYLRIDRRRGVSKPEAGELMATLGQRFLPGPADEFGHALLSLASSGAVMLRDGQGTYSGSVDWLAVTADARHGALFSGTKLSVVFDGASAGVDVGALLGGDLSAHHLTLSVAEDELSLFALPQVGGSVTAFEPGFLFSFRYRPGAREPWDITVARISVAM